MHTNSGTIQFYSLGIQKRIGMCSEINLNCSFQHSSFIAMV